MATGQRFKLPAADSKLKSREELYKNFSIQGSKCLTALNKCFEEKLSWLDSVYEEGLKIFSRNGEFPRTPKVEYKKNNKRRKMDVEEKENESNSKFQEELYISSPNPLKAVSDSKTSNKVKETIQIFEEKTSEKTPKDRQPLSAKNVLEAQPIKENRPQIETVYITTLSPVTLKSAEKLHKNRPIVVVSPLMPEQLIGIDKKPKRSTICKSQRVHHRSSIANTLIRSSITRPSLRRSTLLLSKIRASISCHNSPQMKRDSKIIQQNSQHIEETVNETPKTSAKEGCNSDVTSQTATKKTNKNSAGGEISIDTSDQNSKSEIISRTPSPIYPYNKALKNQNSVNNSSSIQRSTQKNRILVGFQKKVVSYDPENKLSLNSQKVNLNMQLNSKYLASKKSGTPRLNNCATKLYYSPSITNLEKEYKRKELFKLKEIKSKEALKRRDEILRRKMEENKRKREERIQRVQELKEEMERKQLQQFQKLERENELKEKMREETLQKGAIKRSQRIKEKNSEFEKKKKQEQLPKLKQKEEELKQLKLKEMYIARQKEEMRIAREKAELARIQEEEIKRAKMEEEAIKAKIEETTEKDKEIKKNTDTAELNNSNKAVKTCELNKTFNVTEADDSCTNYVITPEIPRIPQSLINPDNYDISHLRSDESTDDEEEPRKQIPAWAQGYNLRGLIIKQHNNPPALNLIFPPFDPPDLAIIFKLKRKRFFTRTSSANWSSPILGLKLDNNQSLSD